MNKAIGVLVIGLGLIMIVIGVTGTQHSVLTSLKSINPKLRSGTNTGSGTNSTGSGGNNPPLATPSNPTGGVL